MVILLRAKTNAHIGYGRSVLPGAVMEHYETEQQMEMYNLDQRMRDAYKDGQRITSRDEAARTSRMHFRTACVLAVLIGISLAIFF